MTYVYVLLTPSGYILGVYANLADAEAFKAKVADIGEARIPTEPVIGGAE